jgi:sulfoxide reductase heme-binding subunit YedZ
MPRVHAGKLLAHAACATPMLLIVHAIWRQSLGPDPVAQLEHELGRWALRLLLAALAVTPLRRLSGIHALLQYRRMLGLWAFAYASAHFAVYLGLDLGGYWAQVFGEIAKRPYITVGFLAWLLLVPLAATSTRAAMRRLGRRWGQLHRVVYAIGVLAVLHFVWVVKSGKNLARLEPLVYAALLALLLLARLPWRRLADAAGERMARLSGSRGTAGRGPMR